MQLSDKIKQAKNIKEYVESATGKKLDRKNQMSPCPICGHNDGFTINDKQNYYKCFCGNGCNGTGGSIIDFYMGFNRVDKDTAIKALAKEFNIDSSFVESKTQQNGTKQETKKQEMDPKQEQKKKPLFNCEDVERWHSAVSETDYFTKRGIGEELIQKYKLGFDKKNNQIVLPVDENYIIKRFIDNKGYRNIINAEEYNKVKNWEYTKEKGVVFIVEGYFDMISLEELGYKAISLNSTSNKEVLVKLIRESYKQGSKTNYILALDNDKAGQECMNYFDATLRGWRINTGRFKFDKQYKDINEYFIANKDELESNLKNFVSNIGKGDLVINYLDTFLNKIGENKDYKPHSTGFLQLNSKLNGGLRSGLYVLGASSSLGKTTFCLQLADYIAKQGTDVLFFSLEMSKFEMVAKSLSRELFKVARTESRHVGTTAIQECNLVGLEEKFNIAINNYHSTAERIQILEGNFDTSVDEVKNRVDRHIQLTGEKPVVFIDYLQILRGRQDGKLSDKQEMDYITSELKRLSRDFDITVIVISSLNRASYYSAISFESFKESGSIEYSADCVIGLELSILKELDTRKITADIKAQINTAKAEIPRKIDLVILKNRNGSCYDRQGFIYYPVNNFLQEVGAK